MRRLASAVLCAAALAPLAGCTDTEPTRQSAQPQEKSGAPSRAATPPPPKPPPPVPGHK